MILFTDYIKRHRLKHATARGLLSFERFKTVRRDGGRVWIDELEPLPEFRDFRNLQLRDRQLLESLLRKGLTKAECARRLGVHPCTITREIRRGVYEHTKSDLTTEPRYSCDKAQEAHELACSGLGPPLKLGRDKALAAYIEQQIAGEKRSPDAVLGRIKALGMNFATTICTTTLYSYISKGVFLNITKANLPEGGRRKRGYKRVAAKRPPKGDSIELRPEEADFRLTPGHWEMDTIKGKQGLKENGLVLTERKSRTQLIRSMPDGSSASVVAELDKLERKLGGLFPMIFKSITADNGPENQDFRGIERSVFGGTRTKVYYCHPYSSFERGSNENQNKHIRRWIPKGAPLTDYSAEDFARVERWLNSNPRRMFGYRTSAEVFEQNFGIPIERFG
jgi:IS30 family transposase